jgi:hypothetical protein
MPLTPITGSLFDVSYVQVQYPVLAARVAMLISPTSTSCSDYPRKFVGLQLFFVGFIS